MENSEKKRITRRLRKILALTDSQSPGEAAAALKQAASIMAKYGLDAIDAEVSAIEESSVQAGGSDLPGWESALANVIRNALGVEIIIRKYTKEPGWRRPRAKLVFLGEGHKAQIASYAYEVLRKQLRAGIKKSIEDAAELISPGMDPKGLKLTKLQRDAYAVAWCAAAEKSISAIAPTLQPEAMQRYFASRGVKDPSPAPKRKKKRKQLDIVGTFMYRAGAADGNKVRLNHAVSSSSDQMSLDLPAPARL